jgi:hypothetical protein
MHLLAERFVFGEDDRDFLEEGSQDLSNGTIAILFLSPHSQLIMAYLAIHFSSKKKACVLMALWSFKMQVHI